MKFSLNFIQEFLKVNLPPEQLAKKLTMAGMEVEGFEKSGSDWIFNIEVTTNRHDWLSIAGIAQEIAAILGKNLRIKSPQDKKQPLLLERKVIIESNQDCSYYLGRSIKGVNIGPGSQKIQSLVVNCGLASINNVVDITNYCMLKWGNPLHAFDQDKLEGNIYVRRAKKNEFFIGIDGKERVLDKENLVIADSKKIIALAGVIGSKNTEVDDSTKNIFLEAAIFSPLTVRRSRRRAGVDTESSYRFERRVSPEYLEFASQEATRLIKEIAGGVLKGVTKAGQKPKISPKKINISLNGLETYLGVKVPEEKFKTIIASLGFKFQAKAKGQYLLFPPLQRFDLIREVDVYEEVSRIYGYEKIPPQIPFLRKAMDSRVVDRGKDIYRFNSELADYLARLGFKEIISYSLQGREELGSNSTLLGIEIINPLRKQENSLRFSLLTGMIKSLGHNLNRSQSGLQFFEVAHIYLNDRKGFSELPALALGRSGKQDEFFLLKGAVEKVLQYASVQIFEFREEKLPFFSDGLTILSKGKVLGFLGKLDQETVKRFSLKEDLFFAQLNLEELAKISGEKRYKPISPYPAVWRDISIALKKQVSFKEVEEVIKARCKHLVDLRIVGFYQGKNIPAQTTAFTLRIFYQSTDKTLTAQEVDIFHNDARQALSQIKGLELR